MFDAPLNLVLPDRVVAGTVALDGPTIGAVTPTGDALVPNTDYLLPGLVDLHTDNAEHHFLPRPGVTWPSALAAILAHDWQMLGAGITTVFDALSFGDFESQGQRSAILGEAIRSSDMARRLGLFRAEHFLHYRCELSDPALEPLLERHAGNPALRLISLMDHTPGQRQWRDLAIYRQYRSKKRGTVWSDAEFDVYLLERLDLQSRWVPRHREAVGQFAEMHGVPIASHDDSSLADIEQSKAAGVEISEFPTTLPAAEQARRVGMRVVMGSPNIVLGGSHSGNVSAAELAAHGLLDILTSDYVPASLLHAPFILADRGIPLHQAVKLVTANPADAVKLADRGRIAPGLRADLLRVRLVDGVPTIRAIWVAGRQYF